MAKLEGKVTVITGGSSGIGLATARRFVDEGAYVFITGSRQDELNRAVKQIGRNVTAVQGDVSKLRQTTKKSRGSSRSSSPSSRWGASVLPRKSRTLPCSSPPTTAASSRASNCS